MNVNPSLQSSPRQETRSPGLLLWRVKVFIYSFKNPCKILIKCLGKSFLIYFPPWKVLEKELLWTEASNCDRNGASFTGAELHPPFLSLLFDTPPLNSLHNLPGTAASKQGGKTTQTYGKLRPADRLGRRMAAKRGYLGFEYKGVTTPRNFISLVSPFFTHLGIWSFEKVIWSSQRTSINLTKWPGRYFHIWQDEDEYELVTKLNQSHKRAWRWIIG